MSAPFIKYKYECRQCSSSNCIKFKKDVLEQFNIGIDFAGELPDGVFIQSINDATIINKRTGADETGTMLGLQTIGTDIDGNNILACVGIQGGESGYQYELSFVVRLDDGFTRLKQCVSFDVTDGCC